MGKNWQEPRESINFKIIEKFTQILGLPFDSVSALNELELLRRKNPSGEKASGEELISLGKKFNLALKFMKAPPEEILHRVGISFPAAFHSDTLGWVFITAVLGPLVRISILSDGTTKWIPAGKFKKLTKKDSSGFYEWIVPDNSFTGIGKNLKSHSHYLDSIKEIIRLEKKDIWAIAIYSISIGIFSLIIPIGIQSLVNILNFGTLFQPVLVLTLLVIASLGFVGVMNVLQNTIAELIEQRLFVRLASTLSYLLPRIKHSDFKKYYGSEIPNYFLDIAIIQKSVSFILTNGLGVILQTVIGLLVLVLYHPIFIIFNIIIITVVIGIIFYLIGPVGIETSIKESKCKHRVASWFEEMSQHKTVFRSGNAQLYAALRSENLVREYIHYKNEHFRALIKQMIGFVSLQALGSGLLLGIGGWLVIEGQITLGQFVASEIIVTKILDNFGKLTKYLETFYDLCASMDKVSHLTDFSAEKNGSDRFEFPSDTPVPVKIKDIVLPSDYVVPELETPGGEIILIKDESGKKASELFDLIYGLSEFDKGKIDIGHYHLQDVSFSSWRNHVYLFRDIEIFSGTISENIKTHLPVTASEIRTVIEETGLNKTIDSFPEGMNTVLYRNGYPLNKEELILVIFSRIAVLKPGLIIIDGILDRLSEESLETILILIGKLKQNSTVLISSSLSEIEKTADRIYVFEKGTLIAKGTGTL